ncbi:hypothetical protein [Oceanimonas baumannii]|uniref:Uncharacterized protein n=1 Tax=Oceanimonas baumannii TaxID=129578 RepID=A0A235CI92_9GAMM|nr:hypothetical protein [Oceanimonas baumannii]OYD23565.1 hypothetical protein B6S09_11500 [Oceanimonas baumannii]TDW56899.1 hypothetical protein LY04_02911 [Oceanimonas baumannii]
MPAQHQRRRVAADTYPLFKHLKHTFIREAGYLSRGHWTLNHLLDYTQLRDEFYDYPWLFPEWLDRLSLQLMDWHHPEHRPLFERFRHSALHEHEDIYAPRPLFWGETRPEEQWADAAPRIHDFGMDYRCNVALLDHEHEQPRMVGNWVLSFALDIPAERPTPALEMTLNSLYLLPEWQGYGVGSAVNRVVSELICKVLSPPLAAAMPEALPAPPAMQFDADYTSRNGQRMGRQIARRLAPLARRHGLLYYDSSCFASQGTVREGVTA